MHEMDMAKKEFLDRMAALSDDEMQEAASQFPSNILFSVLMSRMVGMEQKIAMVAAIINEKGGN